MDPKQDLSVIFGTSDQSIIDTIAQDASVPSFAPGGRVPSRTTAYKGYVQMVKARQKHQKKPVKRVPHSILEK